jgi:hypothetical protein
MVVGVFTNLGQRVCAKRCVSVSWLVFRLNLSLGWLTCYHQPIRPYSSCLLTTPTYDPSSPLEAHIHLRNLFRSNVCQLLFWTKVSRGQTRYVGYSRRGATGEDPTHHGPGTRHRRWAAVVGRRQWAARGSGRRESGRPTRSGRCGSRACPCTWREPG